MKKISLTFSRERERVREKNQKTIGIHARDVHLILYEIYISRSIRCASRT